MSDNPSKGTPASSETASGSDQPADHGEPNQVEAQADDPVAESDTGEQKPGDIAIEVEAGGDGEPASSGGDGAGDAAAEDTGGEGEIAVEVDTKESEAVERIAQLEAEKADLEREKTDNWNRLLRATADLENYRKRARRDVEDARIDARTKVLRPMLEVIDNLERGVEHAEGVDDPEKAHSAILEGVKLVLRQFAQVLERFDVHAVEAVGQPFDPNLHEAISQIETGDHAPGSVVNAPQKGYTIGERLLRPSLVVVAKAPAAPPAESSQGDDGDDQGAGDGQEAADAAPESKAGEGQEA